MSTDSHAEFTFSLHAQQEFAALSGDFNPMHLDEKYARRTMYGGVVAHGVNVVLTALNSVWERGRTLRSLKVRFQRPIYLNEALSVSKRKSAGDKQVIEVASPAETKLVMEIERAESIALAGGFQPGLPPRGEPAALSEIESGLSGDLDLFLDETKACALYPRLGDIEARRLAAILATTRIVGMLCPGEHSIFSELDVNFTDSKPGASSTLHWEVAAYDERFRLARMKIAGDGVEGRIAAFNRPRPFEQPSMLDIVSASSGRPASDVTALVVGGSRGLGETTAKILAARGAKVFLTYRSGAADAERVRNDIISAGGKAEAIKLDLSSESDVERAHEQIGSIDALLYFASPPIFRGSRTFSPPLFDEFIAVYVTDFERLTRSFIERGRPLTVFYPSTVAVSEYTPKMLEYAAAKAAGEQLCRDYPKNYPNVNVLVERLPRLPSDQTQTLVDAPVEISAVDYLNGVVDKMFAQAASTRKS